MAGARGIGENRTRTGTSLENPNEANFVYNFVASGNGAIDGLVFDIEPDASTPAGTHIIGGLATFDSAANEFVIVAVSAPTAIAGSLPAEQQVPFLASFNPTNGVAYTVVYNSDNYLRLGIVDDPSGRSRVAVPFSGGLAVGQRIPVGAGYSGGRTRVYAYSSGTSTDTDPDAFDFTDEPAATASTQYTSNTITPVGYTSAAPISVIGGEYRIGTGAWVSTAGTINPGESVTVRGTSSATPGGTQNVALTIGTMSGVFTMTTAGGGGGSATLTSVSTDNAIASGEASAAFAGSGLSTTNSVRVSSTNTAQTQSWAVSGVSDAGGTITSAIRGNLPFTDINHALTAAAMASSTALASRSITFNPASGFVALPVSDSAANKVVGQSGLAGLGTIPANSQVMVPTTVFGNTINYEMSGGYWTGRISFASYTPTGTVAISGAEYRPGDTGVWESLPIDIAPIGADSTAPNVVGSISVTSITQNAASLSVTFDESGQYGIAIIPAAAADPAIGNVLAGNVSGAAWSRASTAMTANVAATAALSSLVAGQSYKPAIATQDTAGNSRLVVGSTFTMQAASGGDTQAPVISIAVVDAAPLHNFTATPSDNVGVVGVQWLVNGSPFGAELTASPWTFAFDTTGLSAGTYVVTARARDGAGNTAISNAVQIVVGTPGGSSTPPPASGGPGVFEPEPGLWRRVQDR